MTDEELVAGLPVGEPPPGGWPVLLGLHGNGQSGALLRERLPDLGPPGCAVLLPTAPRDARGQPSWYAYDGDQEAFRCALDVAAAALGELLDRTADVLPVDPRRVVLLGYSQGGYLASFAALRDRARYRGLVAISCRVKTEFLEPELAAAAGYPILGLHGRSDRLVRPGPQEAAFAILRARGLDAELVLHEGGHTLRAELAEAANAFAARVVQG